jgi:predicted ABC-type sugar transport system permease subunit
VKGHDFSRAEIAAIIIGGFSCEVSTRCLHSREALKGHGFIRAEIAAIIIGGFSPCGISTEVHQFFGTRFWTFPAFIR